MTETMVLQAINHAIKHQVFIITLISKNTIQRGSKNLEHVENMSLKILQNTL